VKFWTEPSPSDFDRWEELLVQGEEPSTAAKKLGFTCSAFKRASTDRHGAALSLSREARAYFADEKADVWVVEPDASPHLRVAWLKRNQPAFREKQELALTGPDGGVLAVAIVDEEERASALARKLAGLGLAVGGSDPAEPAGDVDSSSAA
jgi:hypothetical protein